jgi:type I restriction enzyme S subunit
MYEQRRWGDISRLKYGKALVGYRETVRGEIPVFGTNGPIGFTDVAQVESPGVIIGRKGAYRGVRFSEVPFWVIDTAYYLAVGDDVIPKWAYYSLQLADINGLDSVSAIPSTTREGFYSLDVLVPPLRDQIAIAEVLGALDDKIAANTNLAETAAASATALFNLAASSPASTRPLAEVVATQYGLTTSAHSDPGPKFLRVTDINKQPWITWNTTPNCSISDSDLVKYRVREGDILVARMADPGKAAYVDAGDPEAVFASYLVRLTANEKTQSLFIYYFLRSDSYLAYAEGAMQGSVQMNMNAKVIVGTEIPLPAASTILAFNDNVRPLRQLIQATLQENRGLVAMRDTLLPQLMSGKLRVKDAEKTVEAVI